MVLWGFATRQHPWLIKTYNMFQDKLLYLHPCCLRQTLVWHGFVCNLKVNFFAALYWYNQTCFSCSISAQLSAHFLPLYFYVTFRNSWSFLRLKPWVWPLWHCQVNLCLVWDTASYTEFYNCVLGFYSKVKFKIISLVCLEKKNRPFEMPIGKHWEIIIWA